MRSVRRTFGTPPTRSKNRTSPSKVCSRSTEVANHQIRPRDQHKMARKHYLAQAPLPRPPRQSDQSN